MDIELIRSNRKTLSLQITPDGRVVVRAPRHLSQWEIQKFLCDKGPWIEKHLPQVRAQAAQEKFTPEELHALADQALTDLSVRAAAFAPLVGVDYGRITIRSQISRWGSCSSKGNLNFNCLLMLAPPAVRDYVVVHELCHRLHMNHSAAFWAEVNRVMPGYEEPKRWLKEYGSALIARLR